MITRIDILKKYASLDTNFIWENIPRLAVIAGINGAGKTKLLEVLNEACRRESTRRDTVWFESKVDLRNRVQYVPIYHNFGSLHKQADRNIYHSGTTQHIETQFTRIAQYMKSNSKGNPEWEKLKKVIANASGRSSEAVTDMTEEEIINAIPPDAACYLENGFNNQYIAEIFKAYKEKIDHSKIKAHDEGKILNEKQIYESIGLPPPWDAINDLFKKQEAFVYRIKPPVTGQQYTPSFTDSGNPDNKAVQFHELSTGEQIIVSLILWAYNQQLGEMNKVFLLDEFDAHLNPSMSRMFIEIIKEKLVREFGVQVIMTTHSPSTVAHVSDDDLFWMERGENIRKTSRKEIIPLLADGIITIDKSNVDLSLNYRISQQGDYIVFVEGITDKVILETAWEKLFPQQKMPFGIIDTPGGNFISSFFNREDFLSHYQDKLFIGLLEFGGFYEKWKEKSKKHYDRHALKNNKDVVLYKNKKHQEYILLLPVPPFRSDYAGEDIANACLSLELLFSDAIIREYCYEHIVSGGDKLRFLDARKAVFALKIMDLEPKEFEHFKPLFNAVISINAENTKGKTNKSSFMNLLKMNFAPAPKS